MHSRNMSKIVTLPNIYTVLWLIQILNSSYNFISDSLSVIELYLLFGWSIIVMFKGFNTSMFKNLKPLNIFFILLCFYGVLRIIDNEDLYIMGIHRLVNSRYFIISHLSSIVPIYVYYYYTAKGKITEKWIRIWSPIFVVSALLVYYAAQQKAMIMQLVDPEGFTNNSGYFVLSVLPALLFWKDKNIIKYLLMAIILSFVVMCMKRGAILIGALMLLLFIKDMLSKGHSGSKLINILFIVVLLFVGYSFITNMMDTNDYFMQRIEATKEGNSSGRNVIYDHLWNYMVWNADILEILFGLGADGTVKAIGQVAHNDWLEYFVDMGVLGMVIFMYMWISFFKMYRNYKGDELYKMALAMILILLFVRTLFSMSLSDISIFVSCVFGFCLYNQSKSPLPKVRVLSI